MALILDEVTHSVTEKRVLRPGFQMSFRRKESPVQDMFSDVPLSWLGLLKDKCGSFSMTDSTERKIAFGKPQLYLKRD